MQFPGAYPSGLTYPGEEQLARAVVAEGIASGEAFGSPSVIRDNEISDVGGIASGEAFGAPSLRLVVGISGIPSEEAFGVASVDLLATPVPLTRTATFAQEQALVGDSTIVRTDLVDDQPDTIDQEFIESWQGAPLTPGAVPGEDTTTAPQHLGTKRPQMRIRVRPGRFNRGYRSWQDGKYPVGATILASNNAHPWQATWTPSASYVELPNVLQADLGKSFSARGVGTATITVENVIYPDNPVGGHAIRRGYMAPLRGYDPPSLPSQNPPKDWTLEPDPDRPGYNKLVEAGVVPNEWGELFDHKLQVTIHQRYGSTGRWVKTFTGLVDDVDVSSRPDRMTITARDFGEVLTDEHLLGWNKDERLIGPTIFVGRKEAEKITDVAYDAEASSRYVNHPAENAIDDDGRSYWRSTHRDSAASTEWVQFRVREGLYEEIFLDPRFDDADPTFEGGGAGVPTYDHVYISINAKALANGDDPERNGVPISEGWVSNGSGTVPGTGTPYVKVFDSPSWAAMKRTLDTEYKLGPDSIIRVSFRGLPAINDTFYAAGVRDVHALHKRIIPEAIKGHWIVVDDVSDVVKVLLRWAGFKEWEIESTGVELPRRLVWNMGDTYMDCIQQVADSIGYTFFMKDPTYKGASIGVPVFRKSWALVNRNHRIYVNDHHLLTAITIKETEEPLSYIIRTRGRTAKNGKTVGGDGEKRLLFVFRPPWIGETWPYLGKVGGVVKHEVHTDNLWKRMDDCRFGAYFIALAQAMQSITATIEFPAYPVDLDEHIMLSDLGTGVISRMAVAERNSSFVTGEKAKWTMTAAGTLIDTPDVQAMVEIINDEAAKR